MSAYLPEEVLVNIFMNLPLKTLVLCTCVSKSWQSVISNPIFISAHLNQNKSRDENCLLLRRCHDTGSKINEQYSLHFDSESLDPYHQLKTQFFEFNRNFKLVGISNGLVCLSCFCFLLLNPSVLLLNPSIRRYVAVPWISDTITIYGTPSNYALGFGFDSRLKDYKVIRLLYFEDNTSFSYRKSPKVELYELSTGSWRVISNKAPHCEMIKSEWTQAFLNGAVHWIAYRENSRGYKCFILRFHMVEECFNIIALPECLVHCSPYDLKVSVLGETLSVMLCEWHCFDTYVSSVWLLENYDIPESWTKFTSFHPSQGLGMVLRLRDNGDMLMTNKSGEVVLYKPENQFVKGLGICGIEDSFYLDTYVESLVLLNEGKGVLD